MTPNWKFPISSFWKNVSLKLDESEYIDFIHKTNIHILHLWYDASYFYCLFNNQMSFIIRFCSMVNKIWGLNRCFFMFERCATTQIFVSRSKILFSKLKLLKPQKHKNYFHIPFQVQVVPQKLLCYTFQLIASEFKDS